MGRHLLAVAACLAATAIAQPAVAAGTIQPGAYMESGGAACTLNFVYDGTGSKAGKVYVGTAAHCVSNVGADVAIQSGEVFGDVAYLGDDGNTAKDFALIEVRTAFLSRVSAAVKGYPQYPTGVATPADTGTGDLIQNSGYGLGFDVTAATREKRQSVLTFQNTEYFEVIGALMFGDSGGPFVHIETGRALGIESRVCIGACTDEGASVQGIIAKATAAGFPIVLRTV